jgi:RNA polymerase sigma-70 factor (ECF subfamily)
MELDVGELLDEARRAWPGIRIADEAFAGWLRERIDPDADADRGRDHVGDLYLACACANGNADAIDAFRSTYARDLAALFDRPHRRGVDPSDLVQALHEHLFVGDAERPPRISEYRGRGSLRTWVRVVALRLRLNAERGRSGKEAQLGESSREALAEGWDVELEYLKAHYRQAFRVAFAEAIAELEPRDRGILRLHVVHGLSATGIATAFGVHRATAKRWLASVRARLLEATRRRLGGALEVEASELDSIMDLIGSRLEASVRRCLEPEVEAAAP